MLVYSGNLGHQVATSDNHGNQDGQSFSDFLMYTIELVEVP